MKQIIFFIIILGMFNLCVWGDEESETSTHPRLLNVSEAKQLWDAGKLDLILDVRTQDEYDSKSGHLPNALLIPVQQLPFRLEELEAYKNKTIGVICHSGVRGRYASNFLRWKGFSKSMNIEGGTQAWANARYPVEHTSAKTVSK